MKLADALLYARTLRHLRPVQLYGRAARSLKRTLQRRQLDLSPAPPRRVARPLPLPADRPPVLLSPTRHQMLGAQGEVAIPSDWDDPARPALWRYHVHYFDDLRARGAAEREAWNLGLIDRWLREQRAGEGTGWDPYPTSLRIVNWVRLGLGTAKLPAVAVQSLAVQARSLRANLEVHLLGNHLLANAKALVFAGAFFSGAEAEEWLAKGLALLERELTEQLLADGGHFERSAMYHSVILEDVLDLIALAEAVPDALTCPPAWRERARVMRRWLAVMCHPDGEIVLFNDAAFGQAAAPSALDEYARRLGLGAVDAREERVVHLVQSGYARVTSGDLVLFVDVGEIGPDYLPGHAHADTLSFEASLAGRRWIVDSGTSLYEPGPERLRQRTTAAHNTVEVDGESSSEVWSSFRVARRARPFDLTLADDGDEVRIACAHTGYRRLPGRVTHRREWRVGPRALTIDDSLDGRFSAAVARLHLHPEVECSDALDRMTGPGLPPVGMASAGLQCARESATWHPTFGARIPSSRISGRFEGTGGQVRLSW